MMSNTLNTCISAKLNLVAATIIQYIHFRLNPDHNRNKKQDRYWFCHTIKQLQSVFPFWSEGTIARGIKSLKDRGLITIEQLHKNKHNHTNWYSINYDVLKELIPESTHDQRYLAPNDKKFISIPK